MNPLEFFLSLCRAGGDVADFDWQGRPAYLISSPELIRDILINAKAEFINPEHEYAQLSGITNSAGRLLLRLRHCGSADARTAFDNFEANVTITNMNLKTYFEQTSADNSVFDVVIPLKIELLRLFTRLLFKLDAENEAAAFLSAADSLEREQVIGKTGDAWSTCPADKELRYLTRSWLARSSGIEVHEVQVTAAIRTLLNGYNATGTALAWCLHLLAEHQDLQQRLGDEVLRMLGKRPPQLQDLPRLPLVRAVMDETLRLYPAAWLLGRSAKLSQTLGNREITAGSLIYISPFTLHRDPRFWQQADQFLPDRFLQAKHARPKYSYLPFGAGERPCPAKPLATPLMSLILAAMLQRFRLRPAAGYWVAPWPLVSLRPHPGIFLQCDRVNK